MSALGGHGVRGKPKAEILGESEHDEEADAGALSLSARGCGGRAWRPPLRRVSCATRG